jgi:hypothetical protein
MRTVLVTIVVGSLLALGSGCAMRVSGVVRDGSTGAPMGGAVVRANDGRSRFVMTNPAGQYAVKTDAETSSLTVSAPGYQPSTVPIPAGPGDPFVYVDLQPIGSARRPTGEARPLVQRLDAPPSSASGGAGTGTGARLKELQSLYDGGLISEAEYKRMRARVVDDF